MEIVFVKKVIMILTHKTIFVIIGSCLPNFVFPIVILLTHAPITHAIVTASYVLNTMKVNVQHVII